MRTRAGLGLVVAMSLGITASADARVALKVSPKQRIVSDSIIVSFKTDRTLKRGYHYAVSLLGYPGDGCASVVMKDSRLRPKKGKVMTFAISPNDDVVNGASAWCPGAASVIVSINKDSSGKPNIVGITAIRFVAMP